MFGWFAPKCPVATWEKAWVEWRMRWLADRLGVHRLLDAEVVLPTDDYFPDPYDGTAEDARRLMDRLCGYMAVDGGQLDLEVCDDLELSGAAGHYDAGGRTTTIRLARSQLDDPQKVLATLAHELAHELLLGKGMLTAEEEDHELVADLLPVFLGVGIFGANCTLEEKSHTEGDWGWWSLQKQGYLSSLVLGYALAVFAFVRREEDPAWEEHLRPDAAAALRDGLRYLRKTNDCLLRPDALDRPRDPPAPPELADRLDDSSPSVRLATLWEIRARGPGQPELAEPVRARLKDPDPAVQAEAVRALPLFGEAALPAVPFLLKALWSGFPGLKTAAAHALGRLPVRPEEVVPDLAAQLDDPNPDVIGEICAALGRMPPPVEPAVPGLLAALEAALVRCDYPVVDTLIGTLRALTPDPKQRLRSYFARRDPELKSLALDALAQHDPAPEAGGPTPGRSSLGRR